MEEMETTDHLKDEIRARIKLDRILYTSILYRCFRLWKKKIIQFSTKTKKIKIATTTRNEKTHADT